MGESERAMFSVHINATKEAVWQELTKTHEPQAGLWNTVLHIEELVPGNKYQMRSPDGRTVNAIGEVLECDPPNLLKQTVRFTQLDDPDCTLTYEIADAPQGGVDLTLVVDGSPEDTKTGKSMRGGGGGQFVCKTIKRVVETGSAGLSTRLMYQFFDILGPSVLPKRTRAERWPMDGANNDQTE